ncbi:MAG: hypothetical protein ACYTX0_30020, partial [Nostoc sp.]
NTIITHPVQLMLTATKVARAVSLSALKCLSFPHPARFYEVAIAYWDRWYIANPDTHLFKRYKC